jgi:hypothetical protein
MTRIALLIDGAGGHGDVVGERRGRALDDSDGVTVSTKKLVQGLPARAVDEAAVNEEQGRRAGSGPPDLGSGGRFHRSARRALDLAGQAVRPDSAPRIPSMLRIIVTTLILDANARS